MRKIRVLHITPSVRLLGARRSLLTLVCHLAGTRIEPIVLAPCAGALTEELDKRRLPWQELRLPPWRKLGSWLTIPSRIAALRRLCDELEIDLIHCNEIYPNPHALMASADAPLSHALGSRLFGSAPVRLVRPVVTHMRLSVTPRMVQNYYLSQATRVIAVSEGAARDFDPFPWKNDKVRVVHNGIDFDEFADARSRRSLVRHGLGYEDRHFVIGQFGLLMPRKRPRFLLEAAPAILRAVPEARFLFIGETSPGQENLLTELQDLARTLQVEHAVQFLPFQRRIAEYFGAIDLNMLVSDDEGFGRVVIEAAAAGVPTVGSNVGGIPELIDHDRTGFLLGSPGMTHDAFWQEMPRFVEIVTRLAQNRQNAMDMGAAAMTRAQQRFSADSYVQNVATVFDEAMEDFGR